MLQFKNKENYLRFHNDINKAEMSRQYLDYKSNCIYDLPIITRYHSPRF